jgi:hypothetical protein
MHENVNNILSTTLTSTILVILATQFQSLVGFLEIEQKQHKELKCMFFSLMLYLPINPSMLYPYSHQLQ